MSVSSKIERVLEEEADPFARSFKTYIGARLHMFTPGFAKRVAAHTPEGHVVNTIDIMSDKTGWNLRPRFESIKTPTRTWSYPFDKVFPSAAKANDHLGKYEFLYPARAAAPEGQVLDDVMIERLGWRRFKLVPVYEQATVFNRTFDTSEAAYAYAETDEFKDALAKARTGLEDGKSIHPILGRPFGKNGPEEWIFVVFPKKEHADIKPLWTEKTNAGRNKGAQFER